MRDLCATVVGLSSGSSVNYAQAVAQIVDFYLDDARAEERAVLRVSEEGQVTPLETEVISNLPNACI